MEVEKDKRHVQLGMNPSTAQNRLVKDILFDFVVRMGEDKCFRCGSVVSRDDFSIEHKTAWLDSDEPQKLFFDLDNIAYSHMKCNFAAARKPGRSLIPYKQRQADAAKRAWQALTKEQQQELRREKYRKYNK